LRTKCLCLLTRETRKHASLMNSTATQVYEREGRYSPPMGKDINPEDMIDQAHGRLLQAMKKRGKVLVAFSGGVDSGLVLKLAHDALGDSCLAAIGDSPSLPRRELEAAQGMAAEIGAPFKVVELRELENERYRENTGFRCYYCRTELASALKDLAAVSGFTTIADGANVSDLSDYRPGLKAADENGFWHPLIEFRLDKPAVRAMVRHLGLSWHDKPSSPCLSSRIKTGERVTLEKLAMIEEGEDFLHDFGFRVVRVRYIGGAARIEVPAEDVSRISDPPVLEEVETRLKEVGFASVEVDPKGYRQGSMNKRA